MVDTLLRQKQKRAASMSGRVSGMYSEACGNRPSPQMDQSQGVRPGVFAQSRLISLLEFVQREQVIGSRDIVPDLESVHRRRRRSPH